MSQAAQVGERNGSESPLYSNFPNIRYRTPPFDIPLVQLQLSCYEFRSFPLDLSGALPSGLTLLAQPSPVWRGSMAKNPLRCVVHRTKEHIRTDWGPGNDFLHEILECGHPACTIALLPEHYTAKRRRCAACGSGYQGSPSRCVGTQAAEGQRCSPDAGSLVRVSSADGERIPAAALTDGESCKSHNQLAMLGGSGQKSVSKRMGAGTGMARSATAMGNSTLVADMCAPIAIRGGCLANDCSKQTNSITYAETGDASDLPTSKSSALEKTHCEVKAAPHSKRAKRHVSVDTLSLGKTYTSDQTRVNANAEFARSSGAADPQELQGSLPSNSKSQVGGVHLESPHTVRVVDAPVMTPKTAKFLSPIPAAARDHIVNPNKVIAPNRERLETRANTRVLIPPKQRAWNIRPSSSPPPHQAALTEWGFSQRRLKLPRNRRSQSAPRKWRKGLVHK